METEILTEEEIQDLTGYRSRAWQIRWLKANQWKHFTSGGGRPLVGRQYARIRLGAPVPQEEHPAAPRPAWTPDFSRVN